MRILLKTLLYLVGLIVLLLGAVAVYLTQFFDANQFKPQVLDAAERAGIPLEINGALNITVFPRLGLNINQVVVRQPEDPKTILASVEQVSVSVQVMPLLSGSVEVDRVLVDRLQADLIVDRSGRGNWQGLIPESGAQDATAVVSPDNNQSVANTQSSQKTLPAIKVQGVDIQDARFSFTDLQQKTRFDLQALNLSSDQVQLGREFPITLSARLLSQEPQLSADIQLQANLLADLQKERYGMGQIRLQIEAQTPLVPGNRAQLELQADALADLKGDYARFLAHKLNINGIESRIDSEISPLSANPVVAGTLEIRTFNLKALLDSMAIVLPEMARQDALNRVALKAGFTASADAASISQLLVQLDDTRIQGQASLALPSQAIQARLDIDRLNADHYLPPVTEGEAVAETEEKPPAAGNTPETDLLPVELIRSLNADAKINLKQLTIKQLDISDIQLAVTAQGGVVDLSKANARLYDGRITNIGRLDARSTPLTLRLQHTTSGVQITPVLAQLIDFADVTGAVNANADFSTKTNRLSTLIANLQGKVDFDIRDGAFLGTNLAREMCNVLGDAKNVRWSSNTEFTSLKGSMVFTNGVGENQDMIIATPGIMLTGFGSLNLPKERFDYNLGAQITDAHEATCTVNPRFKAIRWPVACKGSYGTPFDLSCGPDFRAIGSTVADMAKAEAKAKLDAEKARLKAKAEEEKARLKAKAAAEQARLEAEAKAKLDAEKQRLEEKAKDKLKSLFQ